jgi:hypothetical protein
MVDFLEDCWWEGLVGECSVLLTCRGRLKEVVRESNNPIRNFAGIIDSPEARRNDRYRWHFYFVENSEHRRPGIKARERSG